jgi:hypothetical protein
MIIMTVKQLREKLKEFDDNTPVVFEYCWELIDLGMPDSVTTISRDDVHPDAPHYEELVVVLK